MLLWLSYLFTFYRTRKDRVHSECKKVDITHVYWRIQYNTFEVFTCTANLFVFIDQFLIFLLSVFVFLFGGCHWLLNVDIFLQFGFKTRNILNMLLIYKSFIWNIVRMKCTLAEVRDERKSCLVV